MEVVATVGAQRPADSFFNMDITPTRQTQMQELLDTLRVAPLPPVLHHHNKKEEVDSEKRREILEAAAVHDWNTCVKRSSALSVQLCEALRLVLEPTRASRMKGDFRTGKRLNMRKVGLNVSNRLILIVYKLC